MTWFLSSLVQNQVILPFIEDDVKSKGTSHDKMLYIVEHVERVTTGVHGFISSDAPY